MRRAELQRRHRADLAWYLAGAVVVQLALAVAIDSCWLRVRDPDYCDLESIVHDRQAEAPGRPLVVAIGSSRMHMALAAKELNRRDDPSAPVVINAAMSGGGPIMNYVTLRRLLDAGVHPDLVFVEIAPCMLSIRDGAPIEERQRYQGRHTLLEVVRLWRYYTERYRLCYPYFLARVLPAYRYQAELRAAVGLDLPADDEGSMTMRDEYGWLTCPSNYPPEAVAWRTQHNFSYYKIPLSQPRLAPGAVRSLRDTLRLCVDRHIPAVVIIPPLCSQFRAYAPDVDEVHTSAVRELASEMAVPLLDCRDWVDDAGFWDGHHTTLGGALQFTERLGREVLRRPTMVWAQVQRAAGLVRLVPAVYTAGTSPAARRR